MTEADAMSEEAVRRAQGRHGLHGHAQQHSWPEPRYSRLLDRSSRADEAVAQALALYEEKGNYLRPGSLKNGIAERKTPSGAFLRSARLYARYIARTLGEVPCVPPWPADATKPDRPPTSQPARG